MITFGLHRHLSKLKEFLSNWKAKVTEEARKKFYEALINEIKDSFPIELAVMTQSEYSRGVTCNTKGHPGMKENLGVNGPSAFTCSINFASAQHVDIRDAGVGVFVWFRDCDKITKDGYFLLSNTMVHVNEVDYNGVAIKLVDGVMLTFDGRMIRHGTTKCHHNGKIYGFHVGPNAITIWSKVD